MMLDANTFTKMINFFNDINSLYLTGRAAMPYTSNQKTVNVTGFLIEGLRFSHVITRFILRRNYVIL